MQVRADFTTAALAERLQHTRRFRLRRHLVRHEIRRPDLETIAERLQARQAGGIFHREAPAAFERPLIVGLGVDRRQKDRLRHD